MKFLNIWVLLALTVAACNKKKADVSEQVPLPGPAELLQPAQNAACVEGGAVSETVSFVTFKWKAAANVDIYELQVKNLLTKEQVIQKTNATELALSLQRNIPYSWWVISRSNRISDTVQTGAWKFYNAGVARLFYAPFAADLLSPAADQEINAVEGKVKLEWKGADPDNDLEEYDIYLGTEASNMQLIKAKLPHRDGASMILADVAVQPQTTYYWKVISRDSRGNTADGQAAVFKTK